LVPSPVIATSLPPCCFANQRHLVFRRGLREEVVDAGLVGDGLRGERVVAGDHHRADAHLAQFGEPLADALLDDVLEMDHAERPRRAGRASLRHHERRAADGGDGVHHLAKLWRQRPVSRPDPLADGA
jgi:hypothetical protein